MPAGGLSRWKTVPLAFLISFENVVGTNDILPEANCRFGRANAGRT